MQQQWAPVPPPPPMPMQGQPMPQQQAYAPMPPQQQYMPPQQGMGGGMPVAGQPMAGGQQPIGGQQGQQMAPPGPPKPPANFQLGALLPAELQIPVPAHQLNFDEKYFIRLLAGSISHTKDENTRIIESIPKLKQTQLVELLRIFDVENKKFAELFDEHVPQHQKLAQLHFDD